MNHPVLDFIRNIVTIAMGGTIIQSREDYFDTKVGTRTLRVALENSATAVVYSRDLDGMFTKIRGRIDLTSASSKVEMVVHRVLGPIPQLFFHHESDPYGYEKERASCDTPEGAYLRELALEEGITYDVVPGKLEPELYKPRHEVKFVPPIETVAENELKKMHI